MNKLGQNGTKWLKTVHVISACLWGGGAVTLVLLHWAVPATSGDALFARDLCMKLVDDWVVTSGALGCLITGLIFSLPGGWGFFRFPWITIKWIVNVGFIAFGGVFFVPWLNRMSHLSNINRIKALQDPYYLQAKWANQITAVFMVACLFMMIWLTIFKPWKKGWPHVGPRHNH